jgi:alpha-acetolactate decarboxylase
MANAFTAVRVDIEPLNVHHKMKQKKERRITNRTRVLKGASIAEKPDIGQSIAGIKKPIKIRGLQDSNLSQA